LELKARAQAPLSNLVFTVGRRRATWRATIVLRLVNASSPSLIAENVFWQFTASPAIQRTPAHSRCAEQFSAEQPGGHQHAAQSIPVALVQDLKAEQCFARVVGRMLIGLLHKIPG